MTTRDRRSTPGITTDTTESRARSSPIDLEPARKLARGSAQRAWLQAMLTPDTGLQINTVTGRRWSASTYQRILVFIDSLWAAGYDLNHQPGIRGGCGTWHLDNHHPEQATRRQLLARLSGSIHRQIRWNGNSIDTDHALALLHDENELTIAHALHLTANACTPSFWSRADASTVIGACRVEPNHPSAHQRLNLICLLLGHEHLPRTPLALVGTIADGIPQPSRS